MTASSAIRLELDDNVTEGRRRREVHDPHERGLFAQGHGRPIPLAAREKLAPRRIPDPLIPNLLPQMLHAFPSSRRRGLPALQ